MGSRQCAAGRQQKSMDVFDLTKFVLAFFVVAIHTGLFPSILYPWLRVAVPVFFMISGYILFRRINQVAEGEKTSCVMGYVRRNLKLYAVWFVILLPVTILVRRGWFADGVVMGIYRCVRALLFGSTFGASWFLTASVTAVVLVHKMSEKMGMRWVLAVSAVCYILCCINSRYQWLAEKWGLASLLGVLEFLFGKIENTFLVALLWIAIGKAMAEKKAAASVKRTAFALVFWAMVLYGEHVVSVRFFRGAENADCYFALVPFCVCLFSLLEAGKNVSIPQAKTLRICSTLIYVTHKSFLPCANMMLKILGISPSAWKLFLLTSVSLTLLSLLLIYLSRYPKLRKIKMLW